MNWLSWEVPKNSLMAAVTGRMLMSVLGVMASTSWVVMRSRTWRSMRLMPVRTWDWMSSPTARMRRLPRWSMSSYSTATSMISPSCTPSTLWAPACSASRYLMAATTSSMRSTESVRGASRPSFLLIL